MKLIKQSYEILEQKIPVRKPDDYSGSHFREQYIDNMYKHIERCGKTCYRSEHTIKKDSAAKFVDRLINSGHTSVLEHGTVYLRIPFQAKDVDAYSSNPYSKCSFIADKLSWYITTNYRVIIENHLEDDLQYLCIPTEYHIKRHTVLLHSCIHVYKDLTRHRKMSFSIESTRFVNYAKNKYGNELKFIKVPWLQLDVNDDHDAETDFYGVLDHIEKSYLDLINIYHWQPQQAAEILPQCTAADVVISGYDDDWKFVFSLRTDEAATGQPHPLVKEIMNPLKEEFIKNGWCK